MSSEKPITFNLESFLSDVDKRYADASYFLERTQPVRDVESPLLKKALLHWYGHHSLWLFAVIVKAAYTERKSLFALSRRTLEPLVNADPDTSRTSVNSTDYGRLMACAKVADLIHEVEKPGTTLDKNGNVKGLAGLYKLPEGIIQLWLIAETPAQSADILESALESRDKVNELVSTYRK